MRASLVFAVLLGLLIGASSNAGDGAKNGIWWNSLPKGQKAAFILGFSEGAVHGYLLFDGALYLTHQKFDPEFLRSIAPAEKAAEQKIRRDFGDRPAGQIADGLDALYTDYRNTAIDVSDAIQVVMYTLNGAPATDIAKLLERKRNPVAK